MSEAQFVRHSPHNMAILPVHFSHSNILSTVPGMKVVRNPRKSPPLWAWKFAERMEVHSINASDDKANKSLQQLSIHSRILRISGCIYLQER